MKDPAQYISSGALETYLLGEMSLEQQREFQEMMAHHPEVRTAFSEMEEASKALHRAAAVAPAPKTKASLFAALKDDFAGTAPAVPPVLHGKSTAADYQSWLQTEGLEAPEDYDNIHFVPLDQSEQGATALVWMKVGSPAEVHTDVIEKFLILNGACTIEIEGEAHQLQAGDYLSIPMFKSHTVTVTSQIPCKILLQRIAA